jgi:hypothetical protein
LSLVQFQHQTTLTSYDKNIEFGTSDVNELFKTPEGIHNAVKHGILTQKLEQLVKFLIEKRYEKS